MKSYWFSYKSGGVDRVILIKDKDLNQAITHFGIYYHNVEEVYSIKCITPSEVITSQK